MDYIGDLPEGDDLGNEHCGGGDNLNYSEYDATFDFSRREHLELDNGVTNRLRRRHPK